MPWDAAKLAGHAAPPHKISAYTVIFRNAIVTSQPWHDRLAGAYARCISDPCAEAMRKEGGATGGSHCTTRTVWNALYSLGFAAGHAAPDIWFHLEALRSQIALKINGPLLTFAYLSKMDHFHGRDPFVCPRESENSSGW